MKQYVTCAAASFGLTEFVDYTATVSDTQGDPHVEVTVVGSDESSTLNFAFSGIKGETGPQGPMGPQGPSGYVLTEADVDDISSEVMERYQPPVATSSTLGAVIPDGSTITVDPDGTIHGANTYELPVATTLSLGGVKPDGTTVTIDADGTIHGATTYELPRATTMSLGGVIPDGSTITVDPDGTIHGHGGGIDFDGYRYGYITSSAYYSRSAYIFGDESDGAYTFANMASIPSSAFSNVASIRSVTFPAATSMGAYAFYYCTNLTAAEFPRLTSVAGYAFSYCTNLAKVGLPMCRTIGYEAFWNCYYLSEISLPSCSNIREWAFENCRRLMRVDLTGVSSVPTLDGSYAFDGTPISGYTTYTGGYGSIYVPSSLYAGFRTATNWSYYSKRMVSA